MFGLNPSEPAKRSLEILKKNNIYSLIEFGSGLGRDSIFFAKNKLNVQSLDYSKEGIKVIKKKIKDYNLKNITTKIFDIRNKLPFKDNSVDACFSHMLYCMALTSKELVNFNNEINRVLKNGGLNIYTVRNEKDGDFQKGIPRGEDMFENDGFIVHFFNKAKIYSLMDGFKNIILDDFVEGNFPRKLYFVANKKII